MFLWLQRFLSQFSYTNKTRFICALGVFYAFFLTLEIFFSQSLLLQMFQKKHIGVERHRSLIKLFEYTIDLEMGLGSHRKQPERLEKRIEELMEEISLVLKNIENAMRVQSSDLRFLDQENVTEENFFVDTVVRQWESIKAEQKLGKTLPMIVLIDFSQNILKLINKNMEDNSLKLGVKMPVVLISHVVMLRVPGLQNIVANIATLPVLIKQGLSENDAKLLYQQLLMTLENKVASTQADLAQVVKQNYDDEIVAVKKAFDEMQKGLETYIEYLKKPHQNFITSLSRATQVLQEGWKVEDIFINFLDKAVQEAIEILYRRQRTSFIVLFMGLTAFLLMYMTRIIRRPLQELKHAAMALADGDLSVRVPVTSKDEVATIIQAFNAMAEVWEKSLLQTKKVALHLVDASMSIFEIAKNLEANVVSQEVSVHSMKVQTKEIGLTTHKFSQVLREVNASIASTSNLAEIGKFQLVEMEAITDQMKEASCLLVDTLDLIGAQVDKINGVLMTVVSIADQSNLLSLNTAIRASKTGIRGAGFAVVAVKIRELADRIAFATLDIEQIVQGIVKTVSSAVSDVEKFSVQILDQVADEKKISEQLTLRINQTEQQLKTFKKIQNDMDMQFKESLQITSLINDLLQVTSNTGKSARKLKQDVEFLSQGTQNLQKIIERFHFRT